MTAAKERSPPRDFHFARKLVDEKVSFKPTSIETLQLNITKLCNQACVHCHVDSSPRRREMTSDAVLDRCLELLRDFPEIKTFDLTGGAPELHPRFREAVRTTRSFGKRVIVRHNLTVQMDPHPITKESLADLPEFFAEQGVEVVSSLPYYQEYFTDKQRGSGVFKKSMAALRRLNDVGYGKDGTGLILNLVYNPVGPFLPASQHTLEADYKRELKSKFDLDFNQLFAITNMPIHRFKVQLIRGGNYDAYMEKLVAAFNPTAADGVMCRSMISVSYDGKLYDCDFNQMLGMQIENQGQQLSIFDFDTKLLLERSVAVADHCYGCTAGSGSSCGGNTA
jgi:radical SAM/Cys-rich protein